MNKGRLCVFIVHIAAGWQLSQLGTNKPRPFLICIANARRLLAGLFLYANYGQSTPLDLPLMRWRKSQNWKRIFVRKQA